MMNQRRPMRVPEPTVVATESPAIPLSEGMVLVSMILLVLASPFLYDLALAFGLAR